MQSDTLNEGLINKSVEEDNEGYGNLVNENKEEEESGEQEAGLEEEDLIVEKEGLEKDEQDEDEGKGFIRLKEGISWWNASNIFITYFVSISQIVFFDLCLVYLLKSESYFNVPQRDVASLAANIVFFSQPFTLLFDIILGYMHDKLGRKVTCVISTLVCVIAFAILPFITTIYPGLLIIRIMLNFSVKGPITAPLAADYVLSSTRGKATALTGLGAGFGAIFSVFVLFSITKHTSFTFSFFIAAGVYFILTLYMLLTIKDVKREQREGSQISSFFSWRRLKTTTKTVWKVSRTSREINLSYYGSFVTRMGDILSILFMNIWIASFFGSEDEEISKANNRGQMISGIGGVLILVLSFFVGWGTDKMKFVWTITIYYGIRAVFYFLIIFADHPSSIQAFMFFMIIYTSNGLLNIIINAYFYKVIRKEHKGTLNGIFLFFGTLGILLISKLGAVFFDNVSKSGPFLLGCAFDLSFILLFLIFHRVPRE